MNSGFISYPRTGERGKRPRDFRLPVLSDAVLEYIISSDAAVTSAVIAVHSVLALPAPVFKDRELQAREYLRAAYAIPLDRSVSGVVPPPGSSYYTYPNVLDVKQRSYPTEVAFAGMGFAPEDLSVRDFEVASFSGRIVPTVFQEGDMHLRIVGTIVDSNGRLGCNLPGGTFGIPLFMRGANLTTDTVYRLYEYRCTHRQLTLPQFRAYLAAQLPALAHEHIQRLSAVIYGLPSSEAQWRSEYAVTEFFNGNYGLVIVRFTECIPVYIGRAAPQASSVPHQYFQGGGIQSLIPQRRSAPGTSFVPPVTTADIRPFPVQH